MANKEFTLREVLNSLLDSETFYTFIHYNEDNRSSAFCNIYYSNTSDRLVELSARAKNLVLVSRNETLRFELDSTLCKIEGNCICLSSGETIEVLKSTLAEISIK